MMNSLDLYMVTAYEVFHLQLSSPTCPTVPMYKGKPSVLISFDRPLMFDVDPLMDSAAINGGGATTHVKTIDTTRKHVQSHMKTFLFSS